MSAENAGNPIRILVCEDEASLRADLAAVLCEAGYLVSQATDGIAARDLLESETFDLILCDISMPRLDGFELLSQVRSGYPDLAEVPFLFLTALADREQVIAGKRAGADDYLIKPIDYGVMLATVAAHLRQVARLRDSLARKATETRGVLNKALSPNAYSALDSLAPAIVLLDASGEVVYANSAAAELIAASEGVLRTRLSLGVPPAIQHARAADDVAENLVFLRLPQQAGEQELIILLSLLPTPPSVDDPAVMALLIDPRHRTPPADAMLKNAFGLTPTEARVASLLTQGDRLEEIAQGLNIQQSTVVFHLRNIFAKTSTNRQTDLVALLLSLTVAQSLKGRSE